MLLINQFGTTNVKRDEEIAAYGDAPFRTKAKASGILETRFEPLQLLEGDYLVSFGILPNRPSIVDFYEYHHQLYKIRVSRGVIPRPRSSTRGSDSRTIERRPHQAAAPGVQRP